jgi:GntR family transcriptional regulator/MocR family aminotransferase
VVSLGTVSKSLAPGLRLGWAVAPPHLARQLIDAKSIVDRGNPALDQRALALLMSSGRYDRHLRRMRAEYAHRRETLVAAVARWTPQLRVSGLAAGFHAVLHLPAGSDEQALVARARERGLGIGAMSRYSATGDASDPRLVLGFGNTSPESIEQGIRMLAEVMR